VIWIKIVGDNLKGTLHKVLSAGSVPQMTQTSTRANWHFGGSFCSKRFTL